MDYINSLMDYLKSIFNQYVFNLNKNVDDSITTIQSVKEIDEKIGNLNEIIDILNEIKPKVMINKKHRFSKKILLNKGEIDFVIKKLEQYQKERSEPLLENYTVDDVILNTNISFVYNKMILIKQRYEIIEEYSNTSQS